MQRVIYLFSDKGSDLQQRKPAWGLFLLLLFLGNVYAEDLGKLRPLTPRDLFRLERLGEVAISPDGQRTCYVLVRPKATAASFGQDYLWDNDHADIWVLSSVTGKSENITNGATDGSGFWGPKWSPDGQRLAMLSTRGGNIRVWVWSKATGRLQIVSDRGVNPWPDVYVWVRNYQLALAVLPEGQKSEAMTIVTHTAAKAAREWAKAFEGKVPTASVLKSGDPASLETKPQGALLAVDVMSGKEQVVATAASFTALSVSPDHCLIAFLKQVATWRPDPRIVPVKHYLETVYELMIAEGQGQLRARPLPGMREVFQGSLFWSPDSTEIAAIGYGATSPGEKEQVFRCKIAAEACRLAADDPLVLNLFSRNLVTNPPLLWYGKHDLLIFAKRENVSATGARQPELSKWWAADEEGHLRVLLGGLKTTPSQILPEADGTSLLAIVDGSIWRINSEGRLGQNLTANFQQKISSVEWPQVQGASVDWGLVFGVRRSSGKELYHLDLKSGQVAPLAKPSLEAKLAAYEPKSGTSVFNANDRTGTYLWLKSADNRAFATVVERNKFLREIGQGELKKVEYRSLDGQDLTAWAILPFGYEEGKRYPVVAWVYAGETYGDEPPEWNNYINQAFPLNLQLLSAHGYVVLQPSMPVKPYGEIDDPYMELMNGVMPALDKLTELGIADPGRLGVMGQSYGGYTTYGLITQTNRFKAAVALAGPSDLVSLYGIFDARKRYQDLVHEDPFRMWNGETAAMGNPPWKDLGRYLRNSPIFYVERVQTPLMIIQGDLDYIAIQQGEEFFTALYRQNKRAEFVRYWGEEHVLDSPANIEDMWERIYAWYDQFLAPLDHGN